MKKLTLFSLSFIALTASMGAMAQAQHANVPGFHDRFTVNFGSQIKPAIQYLYQDGSVFNDFPTFCDSSTCTFGVTDHDSWLSSGNVYYQIGDASTSNKPGCQIKIGDGALYPIATLNANCYNGAIASELSQDGNEYQFTVYTN